MVSLRDRVDLTLISDVARRLAVAHIITPLHAVLSAVCLCLALKKVSSVKSRFEIVPPWLIVYWLPELSFVGLF